MGSVISTLWLIDSFTHSQLFDLRCFTVISSKTDKWGS